MGFAGSTAVLSLHRMIMTTEHFNFTFTENSLEIRKNPLTNRQIAFKLIPYYILLLPIIITVLSFKYSLPVFYAVVFFLYDTSIIFWGIRTIYIEKKSPAVSMYRIDSLGITHRDVNATYTIAWSEIEIFGFVDNNLRFLQGQSTQICLYFSKKSYSKRRLKMRFHLVGLNLFGHCSSDDMIVFALKENFMDDELYLRIMNIINLYCDGSKKVDFLRANSFPQ